LGTRIVRELRIADFGLRIPSRPVPIRNPQSAIRNPQSAIRNESRASCRGQAME